jgi:hypothetical protein
VHVLEVDSSWGADDGKSFGGVRREKWFYSETPVIGANGAEPRWGHLSLRRCAMLVAGGDPPEAARRAAFMVTEGPGEEALGGVFRPKDEP